MDNKNEVVNESKVKLELALKSAHMGVWQFDLINNKRYFDNQTSAILGINPVTFTGTAEEFYLVVHPNDREKIKADLKRTIDEDVPYEPEYRVVWPDGSLHYITSRAKLIKDTEGKPKLITGIIWDITKEKEMVEYMKRQNDDLQKMNKMMIGRELKMIELKKEIDDLRKKLEKTNK